MNNKKIISKTEKLTNLEQFLVDFINNNPEDFIQKTSKEIAKQANVSPSALTRLSKKLNYVNLKALQVKVASEYYLQKKTIIPKQTDSLENRIATLENEYCELIKESLTNLDLVVLESLVEKIIKTKNILVFGLQENANAAVNLTSKLKLVGRSISFNWDFSFQLLTLNKLNKNDLVIIFSNSYFSQEAKFLMKKSWELKVPIAVITDQKKSQLKLKTNYWITLPSFKEHHNFCEINSQILQLIFVKLLLLETNNKLKKHPNQTEKILVEWTKFYS